MKTLIIKTELEQFKEQHPDLYSEVYHMGFTEGYSQGAHGPEQEEEPYDPGYPEYAVRVDDSPRYHMYGTPGEIKSKVEELNLLGYECGNRGSVEDFIERYQTVAWNPTHKLYAIDGLGTLHEIYPHLVDSVEGK